MLPHGAPEALDITVPHLVCMALRHPRLVQSFSEFSRIWSHIRRRGTGRGYRVRLFTKNSATLQIALKGCLKQIAWQRAMCSGRRNRYRGLRVLVVHSPPQLRWLKVQSQPRMCVSGTLVGGISLICAIYDS